jgi:hypothetical protein
MFARLQSSCAVGSLSIPSLKRSRTAVFCRAMQRRKIAGRDAPLKKA